MKNTSLRDTLKSSSARGFISRFIRQRNKLEKYVNIVMSIDGQISRKEARVLIELARDVPPEAVIAEIGSYRGRSTIALALGSRLGNNNCVYAIDPHIKFEGVFGGKFGPQDQAALYRNLTKANVGDMVSVVSLPSLAVAKGWSKRKIGLLFIDGDHRYEAVLADFETWSRFVIKDGIIAFHDSNAPGVRRLIYDALKRREIQQVGEEETLSWFRCRVGAQG